MKNKDEAAVCPTDDENCVSSLIGSVLTLIISILVWLQKVGCNNANLNNCPNARELKPVLEKLNDFARQAEIVGTSVNGPKTFRDGNIKKSSSKVKSNEFRRSSKTKSDENYAVLYAVDQDNNFTEDCRQCCKKVIEPREKKDDNVIFEVVSAQMVATDTQTSITELQDDFTQSEAINAVEKEIESKISCVCVSTQKSEIDQFDKTHQSGAETVDKAVQVENDLKTGSERDGKYNGEAGKNAPSTEDEEAEEEEEEDEVDMDDEDYEEYIPLPTKRSAPHAHPQYRGMPIYPRQAPYSRGQLPMRQQRPPMYYEAPMYKQQYAAAYQPNDPFAPHRYYQQPPPQPYYQKITRTIQRASPNIPQRPLSPTQRSKMVSQECQLNCKGIEKYSQSDSTPPTPMVRSISPKLSENDCLPQCPANVREKPVVDKDGQPEVRTIKSARKVASPPSPIKTGDNPASPPSDKPAPAKEPKQRCIARCSKNANNSQTKTSTSEVKQNKSGSQPISFMPKVAIPIDPRDVQSLEVEQAPSNKDMPVAASYMSVEAAKRKK